MTNAVGLTFRRHSRALLFLVCAVGIYIVCGAVAARSSSSDALEVAATLDLVFFVPGLYYLLLVRGRGWPVITLLPVFLLGLLLAPIALPEGRQGTLGLLRHAAIPAELLLLFLVIRRLAEARARLHGTIDTDVWIRFRAAARSLAGHSRLADGIAYEGALLWYALFSWRSVPEAAPGSLAFSYHRRSAHGAVVAGLLLALGAEIVPVHLLVALWSPTAAWVVTGLSAYAVLWIVGDYRAVCLRPVVVTDHELLARVGLRWTLRARLGAIASVESTAMTPEEGGAVGLKLALVGSPRVTVRFREPVPALGPYGARRRVSAIEIGVDEPERLMRALHERGVTKEG